MARLASTTLISFHLLAGCGPLDSASPAPAPRPSTCVPTGGASGSPASIADVIQLANALLAKQPKELSLPCLVESLERPLATLATYSLFSAQPSVGRRSPRIFLFSGNVTMSVAPAGSGSHLLELADYTSPTRSVKAEIPFPLSAPLTPAQPYERLIFEGGTTCGACHEPETPAAQITVARAFETDVLRPRPEDEVPFPFLQDEMVACDREQEPERCDMLTAVFGHGEVDLRRFSPAARTIYDK
jgi:hypothetical protein